MRILRPLPIALALIAATVTLAACGSSNKSSSSGTSAAPSTAGLANVAVNQGQKKGGTLNIVTSEAWEHLDPGASYFQIDYVAVYALHRPLYSYMPDSNKEVPDLADGPPQISADGKTVTIHIKPNVKFSPPVNRAVTSDDVKYAFERDFNPNVLNAYSSGYYPIVGSDKSKGGPISGIDTPNKTTIVFHLTKNFGGTFYQSLTLPGSAPVPRDYASKFDKKNPSTYDSNPTVQATTGPYMIKSYNAGRELVLVRNPNWDSKTDFRPAYADQIVWKGGGDSNVLARQTLASKDLLLADTPATAVLKLAYQTKKPQLTLPSIGDYYASLNTQIPPFDNENLRRAAVAAANREAYRLARGGALTGTIMTHFLGPAAPEFQTAGGDNGFGFDFLKSPTGDMAVATKYMKLAGYPSGKYTGKASVLLVADNHDPSPKEAAIVQAGLESLGFKVTVKLVPQQTMYSKFCGVVKANINVCPTAGWIPDFADGYAWLYVPFNGKAIIPVNNSNWPQLNDPKINAAMDAAAAINDPAARKQAWANVDKMITSTAPAIPEVWSNQALLRGADVKGVIDVWNADWDLSYSSPQ